MCWGFLIGVKILECFPTAKPERPPNQEVNAFKSQSCWRWKDSLPTAIEIWFCASSNSVLNFYTYCHWHGQTFCCWCHVNRGRRSPFSPSQTFTCSHDPKIDSRIHPIVAIAIISNFSVTQGLGVERASLVRDRITKTDLSADHKKGHWSFYCIKWMSWKLNSAIQIEVVVHSWKSW